MKTTLRKLSRIIATINFTIMATTLSAQYVNIPDAKFASYLNTVIPSAMSGSKMDTTNAAVLTLSRISVENLGVTDLTGVQYFKSLTSLDCGNHYSTLDSNKITSLPTLPVTLDSLNCGNNRIKSLPALPAPLVYFVCCNNRLPKLPSLPSGLVYMDCSGNSSIDSLPVLDSALAFLNCENDGLIKLAQLDSALTSVQCDYNQLDSLPPLPGKLSFLSCYNNQLKNLPFLPNSLLIIVCSNNQLSTLPTLPDSLQMLKCYNNLITALPVLPNTLNYLDCSSNKIPTLPALPNVLGTLICSNNQLPTLPALPASLVYLDCQSNLLPALPTLPVNLNTLYCGANQLPLLPVLPGGLSVLDCSGNQLPALPALPSSLSYLGCASNLLPGLPALPGSLGYLDCSNNPLSSGLPALPGSLYTLMCNSDNLTTLPALPLYLHYFNCNTNSLTSLPILPDSLHTLWCSNNNIACFPVFPISLQDSNSFNITGNPFHCLPNYVHGMDKQTLGYPLCGIGNVNGCPSANGIVGFTYRDMNSNCVKDAGDLNLVNIPMAIYNNSSVWEGQTYTAANGVYDFPDSAGTYKIVADTTGMPFEVQCTHPGTDSVVMVASIDTNVDFSFTCKSGFDVGVQSVVTHGAIFPATQHYLDVVAGDMSQWYGLNCAKGDSGTVQVTVAGPVTYAGPAAGALVPSVSGEVFTYHIADFGAIDNITAFGLLLNTDTTAQTGDSVCVNVAVTPTVDNNPANNNYRYCYSVVNSHDPNVKTVYPVNVLAHYNGWFTYTVYFQNTGTAAAKNILVVDTLDKNLDPKTFQLINYSNENTVQLKGNVLNVNFPNINLPDSTSNPKGSIGFIQYKIKPKKGLNSGTVIKNTGYIYFDYNAAVVTNTTVSKYLEATSVNTIQTESYSSRIFPNPNNGEFTIALQDVQAKCKVVVYNELGQQVFTSLLGSGNTKISLTDKTAGLYLYRITTEEGKLVSEGKLIVN